LFCLHSISFSLYQQMMFGVCCILSVSILIFGISFCLNQQVQ